MLDVAEKIKWALKETNVKKSWTISVYDSTGETLIDTITNDELVQESIEYNEKMCSSDSLEFGLCEGSSLKFQYFGKDSIAGCRVFAKVLIDLDDSTLTDDEKTITIGYFDVDSCIRQQSTGLLQAICYNKLQSQYLDADATDNINNIIDSSSEDTVSIFSVENQLLSAFLKKRMSTPTPGYIEVGDTDTYTSSVAATIDGTSGKIKIEYVYMKCTIDRSGDYATIADDKTYQQLMASPYKTLKNDFFEKVTNAETVWANCLKNETLRTALTVAPLVTFSDGKSKVIERTDVDVPMTLVKPRTVIYRYAYKIQLYVSSSSSVDIYNREGFITYFALNLSKITIDEYLMDSVELLELTKAKLSNVTLRDIISAHYELFCQYGKLDRISDLFGGVELNNSSLLPQDSLYCDDTLYPSGAAESAFKRNYISLYTDSEAQQSFKYLIITYKTTDSDGNETESTLQRTVNSDGNVNYNMSSNWLMKNLVWTADEVGTFADAMVEKMKALRWIPFELDGPGLPYLECGDQLEIASGDNIYTSYILDRTMKGIQSLEDNMNFGSVATF